MKFLVSTVTSWSFGAVEWKILEVVEEKENNKFGLLI